MRKNSLLVFIGTYLLLFCLGIALAAEPRYEDKYNYINANNQGIGVVKAKDEKALISTIQLEFHSSRGQWWGQSEAILLPGYPKVVGEQVQYKYSLTDPESSNKLLVTQLWDRIEKGYRITYMLEAQGTINLARGCVNIIMPGEYGTGRYLRAGKQVYSLARVDAGESVVDLGQQKSADIDLLDGYARVSEDSFNFRWMIQPWTSWGNSIFLLFSEGAQLMLGTPLSFSFNLQLDKALNPPENVQINYLGVGSAKLTWDAATEAGIEYRIYRGSSLDFVLNESALVGSTAQTSFVDTLEQSYDYNYYKVITWEKAYGYSSPSVTVGIKSDITPPNSPGNFVAEVETAGLVSISWTREEPAADGDLAIAYKIYRLSGRQSLEEGSLVGEILQGDSQFENCVFYDRGMPTGQYYYAIVSMDKRGNLSVESALSNEVSIEADKFPPQRPEQLVAWQGKGPQDKQIPKGAVLLTWPMGPAAPEDDDLASFYAVYRSESGDPKKDGVRIAVVPAKEGQNEFLDVSGVGGRRYQYAVTSLDKALNESVSSPIVELTLETASAPIAKGPLDGIPVQSGQLNLSWFGVNAVGDTLSEYVLELSSDPTFAVGTKTTTVKDPSAVVTFPLSDLGQGVWFWRVKAVYASGVNSPYSIVGKFALLDLEKHDLPLDLYVNISPKSFSPYRKEELSIYLTCALDAKLSVSIYQMNGKLVETLEHQLPIGANQNYELKWPGTNKAGERVRNGIYLILIETITGNTINRQVKRVQVFN